MMDMIIFAVGFLVAMTVVYGIFSQVPLEIAKADPAINSDSGS